MMMMIDTLMALWNQDRRKRAMQVMLTFFLMCISISLLFVLLGRSAQPHQSQRATISTATVPAFGNTVIPDLTPTVSVVVGTQPTPAPTTQTPCSTTPSGSANNGAVFYADMQHVQTQTPTPTITNTPTGTGTPYLPKNHNDCGGGGGPLPGVTPTFSVPVTPTVQMTPTVQSTVTPGTSRGGSGWGSNCATSNSISYGAGENVFAIVSTNLWFILSSSLLGTILFYGVIFVVKRRM